jgi:hypothetical protein
VLRAADLGVNGNHRAAARKVGKQNTVVRVVDGYLGFEANDYIKKAARFKLIRRADGDNGGG